MHTKLRPGARSAVKLMASPKLKDLPTATAGQCHPEAKKTMFYSGSCLLPIASLLLA